MTRSTLFFVLAAATLGCSQPTPEQQIVSDAAEALGGRDRIQAVKTITIEAEGINGNLGQDMAPDASGQAFTVSNYRRTLDIAGGRVRIEQTRTPNFAYFQGPAAQKQIQGLDGDVAYNIGATGNATRASNAVAGDRRADMYHHPIAIVRAALDPAATVGNPRTAGAERVVDVTIPARVTFTLAIDGTTSLPTRVVSNSYNANLGDVVIETSFADYQESGGLQLPTHLTTKTDDFTTVDLKVTANTVDAEPGDLAAPAAAASAPAVTGPPPATVSSEELARGVWFLAGQSHNSVLVEFADHLTLIEAPQNETRALAVIAKARELRPDKPLTEVVVSHHHFDHSGGIRAAVSEGLDLIVHKTGAPYYQQAVARAHTIVPDALAKSPKPLTLRTVDEELALKDDTMTVVLYPITGSPHSDTLLMAYFPRERLLVEADVYSPGSAVTPYAANLHENVTKRKLRVDRIAPIHGKVFPFAELVKVVSQPRATD